MIRQSEFDLAAFKHQKMLTCPIEKCFLLSFRRQKEKEMQAVLREILGYLIFLTLLYMCTYGAKDPWSWRYYNSQQNALEYGLNEMYGPMIEGPGYDFEKPLPMDKVIHLIGFFWISFGMFLLLFTVQKLFVKKRVPEHTTEIAEINVAAHPLALLSCL
mgnify:FL=1